MRTAIVIAASALGLWGSTRSGEAAAQEVPAPPEDAGAPATPPDPASATAPAGEALVLPPPPREDGLPPPNLAFERGTARVPAQPQRAPIRYHVRDAREDRARATSSADRAGSPVAEFFGGLLGYGVSGLLGLGMVAAMADGDDEGLVPIAAVGAVVLMGFGTAGGVDLAGDGTGGHGDFWAAFVGSFVGALAASMITGMAVLVDPRGDSIAPPLAIVSFLALPPAGAVVGYGWSAN